MFERLFITHHDLATERLAGRLVPVLGKRQRDTTLCRFTKRRKAALQDFSKDDLQHLVFIGPCTESSLGDFTVLEFVEQLAAAIWPPVDRMLVSHVYFIDTSGALTLRKMALIQELTNHLAQSYFGRLTVHALSYEEALKARNPSVLQAAETTYKPQESLEQRRRRIYDSGTESSRSRKKSESFLFSRTPALEQEEALIYNSLLRRAENLNARLEEEMSGLRLKKRYSRFSFFIGYELNTKQQKQACLQDLLKAQSLEQLQEKAKGWSENRRVFRGWRNTCTQAWFQSRTGVLLEDIQNPCQERVLRSLSQVLAR